MKRWSLLLVLFVVALVLWIVVAPPRFWLNLTKRVDLSDPVAAGEQVVERYECRSCHRIGEQGGLLGPDLTHIVAQADDDFLTRWLQNPKKVKPQAKMPTLRLSDSEIQAVLAYLHHVHETTP